MSLKLFSNSHDGTSATDAAGLLQVRLSERMRLWSSQGKLSVPHPDVVDKRLLGACRVVGVFDRIEEA